MIKQRLEDDLKMLDNSHKRLENPHSYPVGIEENLFVDQEENPRLDKWRRLFCPLHKNPTL